MPGIRRAIVKQAKSCHSKAAWQRFFAEPKVKQRLGSDKLVRSVVFSLLEKDPLSPNYDPAMWTYFIRSCQKAWDQPLAENICRHVAGSHDPELNLAMAETLLDGGHPRDVRRIASRCLRQNDLDDFHRLNFELILSSGYFVEGKSERADAVLGPIDLHRAIDNDAPAKAALTCRNIARMYFSKGIYTKAGLLFERAAGFFTQDKSHNEAALSLYNSAAAYDNAGHGYHDKAMENLGRASRLATRYEIKVVSSYCYCFSGVVYYQKGDHRLAIANLEMAMESLPASEQGLRRVQILSFLCLAKMRLGQFDQALRLYAQRGELCRADAELARAADFPLLDADIQWLGGDWESALATLDQAIAPLRDSQVATIDDLAIVARYLSFKAKAGIKVSGWQKKLKIAPDLQNHRHAWLKYELSLMEQQSLADDSKEHLQEARALLAKATAWGSTSGMQGAHAHILRHLVRIGQFDGEFNEHRSALVSSLESYPNYAHSLPLIDIARSYRQGKFVEAKNLVERFWSKRNLAHPYQRTVLESLRETAHGKAGRVHGELGQKAVDTYARDYLRPSITWELPHSVKIGDTYEINLSCQATVAKFLACLAESPTRSVATSELQQAVWNQSLNQKNWKQKIRNTVSRIRMMFQLSLVPVVLQDSNEVSLNHDIMTFTRHGDSEDTDAVLIELLRNRELSTTELAKLLDLSRSTTKRKLKKALDTRQIQSNKKGRNIYYSVARGA